MPCSPFLGRSFPLASAEELPLYQTEAETSLRSRFPAPSQLVTTSARMHTFLTTCLLATFIATGVSRSCERCWGLGQTCAGPWVDCPHYEDSCCTVQTEMAVGNASFPIVQKGCSRKVKRGIIDRFMSPDMPENCWIMNAAPSIVPGSSQLYLQTFAGLLLLKILACFAPGKRNGNTA